RVGAVAPAKEAIMAKRADRRAWSVCVGAVVALGGGGAARAQLVNKCTWSVPLANPPSNQVMMTPVVADLTGAGLGPSSTVFISFIDSADINNDEDGE